MNLIYIEKFNQFELFFCKQTHSHLSNALWHFTKDIHIRFFFFILRQYWQVRANISGLQKLSTSSLQSVDNFWFESWDKRICPVVEMISLCNCLCLSLSLFIEQKTWWFDRHQLPLNNDPGLFCTAHLDSHWRVP